MKQIRGQQETATPKQASKDTKIQDINRKGSQREMLKTGDGGET